MLQAWYSTNLTPINTWDRGVLLSGTSTAVTNGAYSGEGTTTGAWTGNLAGNSTNAWSSVGSTSGTTADYLGQLWPVAHQVKEVWLRVNRWSTNIRIRAGNSMGSLTTIRTISLATAFNDDYGVPFSSMRPTNTLSRLAPDGFNKFKLPEYTAARYLVIDAPTYGTGIASDSYPNPNTRLGMLQVKLYGI